MQIYKQKKKCPPWHFFRIIYCVFQIFFVPLHAVLVILCGD